jgi:hypothetical protein
MAHRAGAPSAIPMLMPVAGMEIGSSLMTATTQALSRALVAVRDVETLTQLAMFCGAGLLVSLLMLAYGIDLSPGLF